MTMLTIAPVRSMQCTAFLKDSENYNNSQLKRYALSTSISRSFIDLPENIEAKLFIHPLLYSWNIKSAIYSSKSLTITAYFNFILLVHAKIYT